MTDADEYVRPPATTADLTARQLAVAALVARAKTDKQIAYELGITRRTVRTHIEALAFLIHADRARRIHVQIAVWWHAQLPDLHRAA